MNTQDAISRQSTPIGRVARLLLAGAAVPALMGLTATAADASAYPVGVYSPKKVGATQLQGWANMSRDCSGTVGCYNYIKIERRNWYGASFVSGTWANANGWNSITGTLSSGCNAYRTTTDSYNDIAGGYGAGANIGQVGTSSNGTKVYRFQSTWSSGWVTICR